MWFARRFRQRCFVGSKGNCRRRLGLTIEDLDLAERPQDFADCALRYRKGELIRKARPNSGCAGRGCGGMRVGCW